MSALVAAPRAFTRAIRGTSRGRLARRPARGEWSVTEVLGHDARRLAAALAALRAANVDQVRRMSPAQRRAAGRHPEYGRLRVDTMLGHWAEHDLNHLEQIRAALRAGQRSAVRR